ncbi:MAG: hypothetical protein LBF97_00940 [Elusimicrobiota bacterium]|jgi:Holliday junction resolvase|nr:hypothetical protein [Elusimicrobiota bacterium]
MDKIEEEFLEEVLNTKIKPKSRKKGINSKRKGSNGEREVCSLLEQRFKGYFFKRSPQSGAAVGATNIKKVDTYNKNHLDVFAGDIFCSDDKFKFTIEVKFRKDVSFWDLFNNSEIFEWFKQAQQQANITGKIPLLIVKYNNKPFIIYTTCIVDDKIQVFKIGDWCCYRFADFFSQDDDMFFEVKNE